METIPLGQLQRALDRACALLDYAEIESIIDRELTELEMDILENARPHRFEIPEDVNVDLYEQIHGHKPWHLVPIDPDHMVMPLEEMRKKFYGIVPEPRRQAA